MSPAMHFHLTSVDTYFHCIGSADRDLLQEVGINLGREFRPPTEDEEGTFFGDEETEEPAEWTFEDVESDSARDIITQMIMTDLPLDLADEEAYAVQDFFASMVRRSAQVHTIEPDDLRADLEEYFDSDVADEVRELIILGMEEEDFFEVVDAVREAGGSNDLCVRIQMICFGRLPEADEPTFSDLEEEAYTPRFAYLTAREMAAVADEMTQLAPGLAEEHGPIVFFLAGIFTHGAAEGRDLVVTIDE
ncbi:MAG: hypothetical protein ACOCVL_02135 [Candidatus Sumerlaeota bacterium]